MLARSKEAFAETALGIDTAATIAGTLKGLQWVWDNRKTKAGTEAKGLQEAMQKVYGPLKAAVELKVRPEDWKETAKSFGAHLEELGHLASNLDIGVEVDAFPMLCHQVMGGHGERPQARRTSGT